MMQAWFLSIIYLVFSALLHLFDTYRSKLLFLLGLRQKLLDEKSFKLSFGFVGIVLSFLLLMFPIYPGPKFVGDLIPAICVFMQSFYFFYFSARYKDKVKKDNNDAYMGYFLIIIAIVHFLCPMGVLI